MIDNTSKSGPMDGLEDRPIRSFGRRRGRPLSPRQMALMQSRLPDLSIDLDAKPPAQLSDLFAPPINKLALEVGFGGAEHLIERASTNPETGFIGCEPFEEGIAKALVGIEENGLGNIRLHPDDARDLLRWLPNGLISEAYILFPDPWPKTRHRKRRLIQPAFLSLLAQKLRPGASVRFATDIADYLKAALIAFRQTDAFAWRVSKPGDWRERPDDWPATRYEAKAVESGRRCYYLTFHRV